MIVKVQKPMADPKAMWLVRSQDGKFRKLMLPGSMPHGGGQGGRSCPESVFRGDDQRQGDHVRRGSDRTNVVIIAQLIAQHRNSATLIVSEKHH